jgi:TRAP-type uncharacterized transport system fused permease subunit
VLAVGLSAWHYYTAGFGLHNEVAHRAIHLTVVLGCASWSFRGRSGCPARGNGSSRWAWRCSTCCSAGLEPAAPVGQEVPLSAQAGLRRRAAGDRRAVAAASRRTTAATGTSRWRDWVFAALASGFSLYLLVFFDGHLHRAPGQHTPLDLMFGVIAIAMVLEATRRTMGIFLPLLAVATVLYGIFGPYLPGDLAHRGYSVPRVVAHLYKGTEGIYGIPVGVVATFVFHFVLFGIMAQLTGLGQLFVNLATIAAGPLCRRAGQGQRGVSGLFGMISGSPIANTVTTGVMTIPLMKKVGFSPRFAGGWRPAPRAAGRSRRPSWARRPSSWPRRWASRTTS